MLKRKGEKENLSPCNYTQCLLVGNVGSHLMCGNNYLLSAIFEEGEGKKSPDNALSEGFIVRLPE